LYETINPDGTLREAQTGNLILCAVYDEKKGRCGHMTTEEYLNARKS
jgi:hypothetical protein